MSCPTGVLLLHAIQQLKLELMLQVIPFAERCGLLGLDPVLRRSARNAHITLNDVTSWNPAVLLPRVSDHFSLPRAEIVERKGRGEEGEDRLEGTLEVGWSCY